MDKHIERLLLEIADETCKIFPDGRVERRDLRFEDFIRLGRLTRSEIKKYCLDLVNQGFLEKPIFGADLDLLDSLEGFEMSASADAAIQLGFLTEKGRNRLEILKSGV